MNLLPAIEGRNKGIGNLAYIEERRKLKEEDPYKIEGAFNPKKEYKASSNIMTKYYTRQTPREIRNFELNRKDRNRKDK